MDGLNKLSDIIDKLLKDISKYENADGTQQAIKYFYNEKEKAVFDLKREIIHNETLIKILKIKLDTNDKVLKNYIEYFVDKEMEQKWKKRKHYYKKMKSNVMIYV